MTYKGRVKWFQRSPKGCGFIMMPVVQITKESPDFLREILIVEKTKTKIANDNAEIFLHITNIDPLHKIPDVSFSTTQNSSSQIVNVEFDLKAGKYGPLAYKVKIV